MPVAADENHSKLIDAYNERVDEGIVRQEDNMASELEALVAKIKKWSSDHGLPLVLCEREPGNAYRMIWRGAKSDGETAEISARVLDTGNATYTITGVARHPDGALPELVRTFFRPESSV